MVEYSFHAEVKDQHRITIPITTRKLLRVDIGDIVSITIKKENDHETMQ